MLRYNDGRDFAVGRASYIDSLPHIAETTGKIFVKIRIVPAQLDAGAVETELYAQVDTGSPWLILEPGILDAVGLLGTQGLPTSLETRFGTMTGHLERTSITLVAEEGQSVELEATVFVCADWPQGNFLGYTGVLERIRFAVDSSTNTFFFARSDHNNGVAAK